MFSKNLKYYRLKEGLSKAALARKCGMTAMAITNYENGARLPNIERLNSLAEALGVKVGDFLETRNDELIFEHGEFRKNTILNKSKQEYIRECIEDYFNRFFTMIEILGENVLPKPPKVHAISLSDDEEKNAQELKKHLGFPIDGPIEDLVALLENKGILLCYLDIDDGNFSGMNGLVNQYPIIAVNAKMNPERIRSTIVHELAHLMFKNDIGYEQKALEKMADAISGAFLFPKPDAQRELGIKRSNISKDMLMVCKEYGISMMLLVTRAKKIGIITESTAKKFYMSASAKGWRTNEPSRIEMESPSLFEQLVYRGISEGEINIQKGAELLRKTYDEVASNRIKGVEECCI